MATPLQNPQPDQLNLHIGFSRKPDEEKAPNLPNP